MLERIREQFLVDDFISQDFMLIDFDLSNVSENVQKNKIISQAKTKNQLQENLLYPELQDIESIPPVPDIDYNDQKEVDETTVKLCEKLFEELRTKKDLVKKNEFGITQNDINQFIESSYKTFNSLRKFETNENILINEDLREEYEKNNFEYFNDSMNLAKKLNFINDDQYETNFTEFSRKNKAVCMANYIYRLINYNYSDLLEKIHTSEDQSILLERLKNMQNNEFDITKKNMFNAIKITDEELKLDKYTLDELYTKIDTIETLNFSEYFCKKIFNYDDLHTQFLIKIGIDDNKSLQKHYSEVLKILIVYFEIEQDIEILHKELKKPMNNETKQIGPPLFIIATLAILVLRTTMQTVYAQEFTDSSTYALQPLAYEKSTGIYTKNTIRDKANQKALMTYNPGDLNSLPLSDPDRISENILSLPVIRNENEKYALLQEKAPDLGKLVESIVAVDNIANKTWDNYLKKLFTNEKFDYSEQIKQLIRQDIFLKTRMYAHYEINNRIAEDGKSNLETVVDDFKKRWGVDLNLKELEDLEFTILINSKRYITGVENKLKDRPENINKVIKTTAETLDKTIKKYLQDANLLENDSDTIVTTSANTINVKMIEETLESQPGIAKPINVLDEQEQLDLARDMQNFANMLKADIVNNAQNFQIEDLIEERFMSREGQFWFSSENSAIEWLKTTDSFKQIGINFQKEIVETQNDFSIGRNEREEKIEKLELQKTKLENAVIGKFLTTQTLVQQKIIQPKVLEINQKKDLTQKQKQEQISILNRKGLGTFSAKYLKGWFEQLNTLYIKNIITWTLLVFIIKDFFDVVNRISISNKASAKALSVLSSDIFAGFATSVVVNGVLWSQNFYGYDSNSFFERSQDTSTQLQLTRDMTLPFLYITATTTLVSMASSRYGIPGLLLTGAIAIGLDIISLKQETIIDAIYAYSLSKIVFTGFTVISVIEVIRLINNILPVIKAGQRAHRSISQYGSNSNQIGIFGRTIAFLFKPFLIAFNLAVLNQFFLRNFMLTDNIEELETIPGTVTDRMDQITEGFSGTYAIASILVIVAAAFRGIVLTNVGKVTNRGMST